MKVLSPKLHQAIYIFAITTLIIGLPVSKFLMSISQIILLVNWLLEGDLKDKFSRFFKNKSALVLSSIILLHALGLIYSNNLNYGFNDLRIKLPLLFLPLIFSTSKPISKNVFRALLHFFLGSLLVASIISTFILTDTFIHRKVVDIRDVSIFISHVRFGLLLCLGVFITCYLFITSNQIWLKWLYAVLITWLLIFLVLIESITGLSILFITIFILIMIKGIIPESKPLKWIRPALLSVVLILIISFYKTFAYSINPTEKKYTLLKKTKQGNLYNHDLASRQMENGNLLWINYSEEELETSWNQRSSIRYDDKDKKGNPVAVTLVRFLASKGLNKDAEAVHSLTDKEVNSIERGIPNACYQNASRLMVRIHTILWEISEYRKTGFANGHSITQRFEYWMTAWHLIKSNPLIGVGTGDVKDAFMEEYNRANSSLLPQFRLRAHNQYLSIAVGMGIIGLLWFLFTLFYPVFKLNMQYNFLFIVFLIISILSFFTEDTLETQAGVTFFAFFNSFFLFLQHERQET